MDARDDARGSQRDFNLSAIGFLSASNLLHREKARGHGCLTEYRTESSVCPKRDAGIGVPKVPDQCSDFLLHRELRLV